MNFRLLRIFAQRILEETSFKLNKLSAVGDADLIDRPSESDISLRSQSIAGAAQRMWNFRLMRKYPVELV